ncbi:hypothetical protein EVG20_g1012 [Dentipellis fragilis]|uniref:Uncharacterized protein n=1 Tax=Dentipellis fragilis TaxID=205917 RepID=A0A4Y9ZDN0_9AGAM|nr:hypothetical protein EVG20_g1012 [Dentipellis fragilis]
MPPTSRPVLHPPHQNPSDSAQVEAMRKRAVELSLLGKISLSPKEKELVVMVLRLTSSSIPDTAQIMAQAETIADLTQQRDFLCRTFEEERARWEVEKQSFDRTAEALIGKRSRGGDATYREEELERQIAMLDSDNRALRAKIADYHTRVQSVEAELAQLRPVLLMQPYALTHSFQHSHAHHSNTHSSRADPHVKPTRRRKHAQPTADRDQEASDLDLDEAGPSSAATPKHKPRGEYYRRRDTDVFTEGTRHRRHRNQKKGGALLADARAEHLLLAARKLGRERAAVLAGLASAPERDRKREEEVVTATPKTPKKNTAVPATSSTVGIMHLDSAIAPATASTSQQTQTPQPIPKSMTAMKGQAHDRPAASNPRTPLDSLLTAARSISMIEDEDEDEGDQDEYDEPAAGPSRSKPLTRGRAAGLQGSPVPAKRRRIAGPLTNFSASRNTSGPSRKQIEAQPAKGEEITRRTRSALDVLADQAAVAFSSEKEKGPTTRGKGKGKAKAKEGSALSEASKASNSTSRGRSTSGTGMITRARGERVAPSEPPQTEKSAPLRATTSSRRARGQLDKATEPPDPPKDVTPPLAPLIPDTHESQHASAPDNPPSPVESGGPLEATPPDSVLKSPGSPMDVDHVERPQLISVAAAEPEATEVAIAEPTPVVVIEEPSTEPVSTPATAVAVEASPSDIAGPAPTEAAEMSPPTAVESEAPIPPPIPAITQDVAAVGTPDSFAEDQDAEGEPDPQSLEAES